MTISHEDTKDTMDGERRHRGGPYQSADARGRAESLSGEVIAAAIEVHRHLGPGLLESVYQACMIHELQLRGLESGTRCRSRSRTRGISLDLGLRLDLVVEDLVIVELKSVQRLEPVHKLQVLICLRLSGRWLGLLFNFNVPLIKHGLRRLLNGYPVGPT
jgi:GxxExxY protein